MIHTEQTDQLGLLHAISKLTSSYTPHKSPPQLLAGLLENLYPCFSDEEALRFLTVHCYSKQHAGGVKRMEHIPTLFNKYLIPPDETAARLREIVLFLVASHIVSLQNKADARPVLSIFGDKFCIETIMDAGLSPEKTTVRYNEKYETLTLQLPALHEARLGMEFFPWLENDLRNTGKKFIADGGYLVDGKLLDQTVAKVFASTAMGGFADFLQQLFESNRIQTILLAFEKRLVAALSGLDVSVSPAQIASLGKTVVLHALFKPSRFSYQVVVNRAEALNTPYFHSLLLFNSDGRFPMERLHFFHVVLNMALSAINNVIRANRNKPITEKKIRENYFCGMVGGSAVMRQVFDKIRKVARFETDVLVLGESGTGKDMIAQAIHKMSDRKEGPFVPISLSDRPDSLIDSELFGHEKGAFTGAIATRQGYFERAEGGTLFLDEICHVPQNTQTKLLRVLQSREFERLGGQSPIKARVRIICATSEDLRNKDTREKLAFLDPLYYRLEQFVISVPPLRKRKEDIPLIVAYYLEKMDARGRVSISPEALDFLMSMDWPGNVRQLIATLKRAYIEAFDEGCIYPRHFELETGRDATHYGKLSMKLQKTLEFLRRNNFKIDQTLFDINHNAFGISRKTLIRYTRELCLWFLSQYNWDLSEAVCALAGDRENERSVARRFKSYFLGDRRSAGMLTVLSNDPDERALDAFIRENVHHAFKTYVMNLKEQVETGQARPETWSFILNRMISEGQI